MIPGSIATGPSFQKERFFADCAAAFEFLRAFYTLSKEQQEEIVTSINISQVKAHMDRKESKA